MLLRSEVGAKGKNVGGVSQSQQVLEHVILPGNDSLVVRRGCAVR